MTIMDLEPIDPRTARELYLANRQPELSEATLYAHESRLGHFTEWCELNGINNLNEVTGRDLHKYRLWRREDGDLGPLSEKSQIDTLHVFIRWVETIDGVPRNLTEKVISPSLSKSNQMRDVHLESERAYDVLDDLTRYHYASFDHVTITLMWRTMMRTWLHPTTGFGQFLAFNHRPDAGTPLMNQRGGERLVALSVGVCHYWTIGSAKTPIRD